MYVLLYFVYARSYPVYVLTFMAIFAWFDKTCDLSFISKGLRSGGTPLYRYSQLCSILRNDELVKNLVSFSLVILCSFNPLLSSKLSLPPWCLIHVVFHGSMPFSSISPMTFRQPKRPLNCYIYCDLYTANHYIAARALYCFFCS